MSHRARVLPSMAWAVVACVVLLVPASGGVLDGVPLDRPAEAIAIGILLPGLLLIDTRVFAQAWARALLVGLVLLKGVDVATLTPSGFCTVFTSDRPVGGSIANIDLGPPAGLMRSWDVRTWGRDALAECSAITRRDYSTRSRFPAFFLNILQSDNPPVRQVTVVLSGVVTVGDSGVLAFDVAPGEAVALRVNDALVATSSPARASLTPGSHRIHLEARLSGDTWRVVPSWQQGSLWSTALVTPVAPSAIDRALWWWWPQVTSAVALMLLAGWVLHAVRSSPLDARSRWWVLAMSILVAAIAAAAPWAARLAPLALAIALAAPAARVNAGWRNAFWLCGVPWLTLTAALALPRVGEFTLFSRGDDWLTYQVSAYRIYLQGYWFEAGEKLFFYQPLYRWIAGALHLAFGDSSAGEMLWDGAALFVGGVLAYVLCRAAAAERLAIAATVTTLVVCAVTPIWHLVGRSLAEISAAAFAWIAALLLMRSRQTGWSAVLAAGVCATLAFYARLNHLLFVAALVVFLLPPDLPASALRRPLQVFRALPRSQALGYFAVLALGVAILAVRTWIYTGTLNPFAGTSFGLNHTGLAPGTIFSAEVWARVGHSVFAQMMVNEVADPRAVAVFVGSVAALLAVLQVPVMRELPLSLCLAIFGAYAGAFVAHAHGYPGRFSVHVVPLATAAAVMLIGTARPRSRPIKDTKLRNHEWSGSVDVSLAPRPCEAARASAGAAPIITSDARSNTTQNPEGIAGATLAGTHCSKARCTSTNVRSAVPPRRSCPAGCPARSARITRRNRVAIPDSAHAAEQIPAIPRAARAGMLTATACSNAAKSSSDGCTLITRARWGARSSP
jgi:hypothetical protein